MKNSIPFMSARGLNLFPGNAIGLDVGREFSIASIKKAKKNDDTIVISAQRFIGMNDGPDITQIFDIGCRCKIVESIEFPDGMVRIRINPIERFKIDALEDIDGARFCSGNILPEFLSEEDIAEDKRQTVLKALEVSLVEKKSERIERILQHLRSPRGPFKFVMDMGFIMTISNISHKKLTIDQMNQGLFEIDTYSDEEKAQRDLAVSRMQEILAAKNLNEALSRIELLLA